MTNESSDYSPDPTSARERITQAYVEKKFEKEFHEIANIFPMMTDGEYRKLLKDMRSHGLREDIYLYKDKVLDGRSRYRACMELGIEPRFKEWDGRDEPVDFVISKNAKRRHLTPSQCAACAAKATELIEELKGDAKERKIEAGKKYGRGRPKGKVPEKIQEAIEGEVAKEIARIFGANAHYVYDAVNLRKNAPDLFEEVHRGEKTIPDAQKEYRRRTETQSRKEKARTFKGIKNIEILHGDFKERTRSIEDNSISLILTDPPYGKEYIPLWEDLAKTASRVLKPGGYLVTYTGQSYLNQYFSILDKYLTYRWTLAVLHTGSREILYQRFVRCGWKPVLVFYKEPLPKLNLIDDVITVGGRTKEHHDWEQPVSESEKLIEDFSEPGDLILDPFAGSGTVLVAAYLKKRKAIGIDIEEKNIETIKAKLADAEEKSKVEIDVMDFGVNEFIGSEPMEWINLNGTTNFYQ